MLLEILWSMEAQLEVKALELVCQTLHVSVQGTQTSGYCPQCHHPSARQHSQYERHPADLPCVGYAVRLSLTVPRFFCDNTVCPRRTFAAPFPDFLQRYARRTNRLLRQHEAVGFALSGEAGAWLLEILGMPSSPDSLIRLVRAAPEAPADTPRVLGVDEWAKQKGHSYGTILVDLETHQVVDLLDARSAASFQAWLQAHPEVEIITRDRSSDYIEGATQGAPEAIQIADRFHLLRNLVDALKRLVEQQAPTLRAVAREVATEMAATAPQPLAERASGSVEQVAPVSLRQLRFDDVKWLQAAGESQRAIARHLKLDRRTVAKYCAHESYPSRAVAAQSTSTVSAYLPYLVQRWHEGCHVITTLHDELTAQGFSGHYSSVYRAVRRLGVNRSVLPGATVAPVPPVVPLSVSHVAWLLFHPDDRLDAFQQTVRNKLCGRSDELQRGCELAHSFYLMVRERQAEALATWLEAAEQSGLKAFKNFAAGLRRDFEAVHAALSYEWSNGVTEGQVNRLKFLKRSMYGRAKFDLLRKKVLGAPAPA